MVFSAKIVMSHFLNQSGTDLKSGHVSTGRTDSVHSPWATLGLTPGIFGTLEPKHWNNGSRSVCVLAAGRPVSQNLPTSVNVRSKDKTVKHCESH